MSVFDKVIGWFSPRAPTRNQVVVALVVSLLADGIQILLGPAGWLFFDEWVDVMAMILVSAAIGFHPLLLPTFFIELFPVIDCLPTWTACTAAVVVLRRRMASGVPPVIPRPEKLASVSSVKTVGNASAEET